MLLFPVQGISKEQITWIRSDLPPVWIIDGQYKGQGLSDVSEKIIREHLLDYLHVVEVFNARRAFKMMGVVDKVCSVGRFRTVEREQEAYFSMPLPVLPSHRLITAQVNAKKIKVIFNSTNTAVSLEELIINHPELVLGIEKGRSYGPIFDQVIENHSHRQNIIFRSGGDMSIGIFKMLQAKRFHYMIEYPWVSLFQVKEVNIISKLFSFPLKGSNGFISGAVACSKTPWGLAMVERINKIMQLETEKIMQAFARWIPQNGIADFQKANAQVFQQQD